MTETKDTFVGRIVALIPAPFGPKAVVAGIAEAIVRPLTAAIEERTAPLFRPRGEVAGFGPRAPFDVRCADALADEVAVLVRLRMIDARSPAGDALLDYRDPPSTPRADRLARLEAELRRALGEIDRLSRELEIAVTHAGQR